MGGPGCTAEKDYFGFEVAVGDEEELQDVGAGGRALDRGGYVPEVLVGGV